MGLRQRIIETLDRVVTANEKKLDCNIWLSEQQKAAIKRKK